MAVETPETASDARRAVAPAADASWRAGFHQGYAHGGYARAGADLLRALASASAYVPSPTTGGDPGRERERRAVSFAAVPARLPGALDAPPSSTPVSEDPPVGHDVESASRYGGSVSHSEAWASALLEATRSQTTTLRPRKSRRTANFFDATAKKRRARNSRPTKINPSRDDDIGVDTKNKNKNAVNALALTSVQAKTALSAKCFLAALARGAYADASDASEFFFENDETVRSYGDDLDPFVVSRIVDDAYETNVVLGYQGDGLLVAPELLEVNPPGFWTAAPFGPVGGRGKHVSVCVVAPIGDARAAAETAAEIEAQYEAMRLGTMTLLCERTGSSGEGDERSRHRTTSVFSYDPEKEASFDDALARVARAARASTRPGPFVAYVVGSSAGNDKRLTTYAAARASEMDADVCVDFALLPRDRLGRRRCSPAFAREKATSAFAVAARRVLRFAETKTTTDGDALLEEAREPSTRSTPLRSTRERQVLAHGDAFGVSKKEPASLAAFEPPATIRRRLRRESERDINAAPSATLCAYAFSATREAQKETGVPVEKDAEDNAVCSNRWLVATWTDDAGETFAVEARAFSLDAFSLASASDDGLAELADWLVGRTRAFAAAKTAAAGFRVSRRDESEKETRKEKERAERVPRETLNAEDAEDDARRLRRASFFFGDDTTDAATLTSDSSVGAGVVLVEVVPGLGTKARGNCAFAAAVASALAREEGYARENEETASEKKSDHESVIRRDGDAVLVGETRVVVLADDDETSARVSEYSSTDGRATASSAPVALIGADGAVATATRGGASRASNGVRDGFFLETEAPLNEKYRRRLAIATRVADARDFGGVDDDDDDFERKKTNEKYSSSVAFAFAALARASRVARGASTGGGLAGCGSVRDLVPPHVAACASLAATLRDLERVAAGHDA
jgi:hypothetical protein